MKKKLEYEDAELDVVFISDIDIITSSGDIGGWKNESTDSNTDNDGWTVIGDGSW